MGGANLREEVDVAALAHAGVQVHVHDGLLLHLRHGPFVEVGALVGEEPFAVLLLHQRHAELVQVVSLAGLLRVEDDRAGNVLVGLVECHVRAPLSLVVS